MMNEIDLSRVDLNLLSVFEVVFRERHVGRAAAALHLTPSAVSHGLGRLRRMFDDPLFLRTPKGVVPTSRAEELAPPIGDILVRVRAVVGTTAPFDPKATTRRFTLGAPDGVSVVLLPRLLAELRRSAPGIDVSVVHLLPYETVASLDARRVDLAIAPIDDVPARFTASVAYEEGFVIAARRGHPFFARPTMKSYCAALHVVVSATGDATGHVDLELAKLGRSRRVALVAPSTMAALAALAETDLLAALPSTLVAAHGKRFGLASARAPFALRTWQLRCIAPRAAEADAGLTWLTGVIGRAGARLGAT